MYEPINRHIKKTGLDYFSPKDNNLVIGKRVER